MCLSYFLIGVNKDLRVNNFWGKALFWHWPEEIQSILAGKRWCLETLLMEAGVGSVLCWTRQQTERLASPFSSMVPSEPQSIRSLPKVQVPLTPQLIVYETPSQTHQSSCLWTWSLPLKFVILSALMLRGAVFPSEQKGYSGDVEFLPIQCRLAATKASEGQLAKVTLIFREERNILIPGFLSPIVLPFYHLLFIIEKGWNNVSPFWILWGKFQRHSQICKIALHD